MAPYSHPRQKPRGSSPALSTCHISQGHSSPLNPQPLSLQCPRVYTQSIILGKRSLPPAGLSVMSPSPLLSLSSLHVSWARLEQKRLNMAPSSLPVACCPEEELGPLPEGNSSTTESKTQSCVSPSSCCARVSAAGTSSAERVGPF